MLTDLRLFSRQNLEQRVGYGGDKEGSRMTPRVFACVVGHREVASCPGPESLPEALEEKEHHKSLRRDTSFLLRTVDTLGEEDTMGDGCQRVPLISELSTITPGGESSRVRWLNSIFW